MDWQPGDIAACYGTEPVSLAIAAATSTPFAPRGLQLAPSHVAIIAREMQVGGTMGPPVWVESTSICPRVCLVQGKRVAGVQVHRPEQRVRDYEGRVVRYRPHRLWRFEGRELIDLSRTLYGFVRNETAYDTRGALLSRSHVLQYLSCLAGEPLTTLFCSELIAAVLQRFGRLCSSTHPGKFHPAKLLRRLVRMGVYQAVPPPQPLRVYDPDGLNSRGGRPAHRATHANTDADGPGAPAAS